MQSFNATVNDIAAQGPRVTGSVETAHSEAVCSGLRTVTLMLPLFHNPDRLGVRLPVGFGKIRQTVRELKRQFSGFTLSIRLGWCTEDGVWDLHLCVEIDTEVTPDIELYLDWWKEVLRERFRQRSIYAKSSDPVRWI